MSRYWLLGPQLAADLGCGPSRWAEVWNLYLGELSERELSVIRRGIEAASELLDSL
jgi:hypothetical protein